jgi:hypothetical protein
MKITERAERSVANTIEDENTWPTDDEIRNHAYELFLARRADEPGSDLDDWLAAEAQLKAAGKRAMKLGKS